MRLDKDSYYIYYRTDRDEEIAHMSHYIDVWDNGFSVDDYNIACNYIDYEDADWNGISPDDSRAGKRILKRYFDRWVKRINDCKKEIEQMVNPILERL